MVHDRVAHQHNFHDVSDVGICLLAHFFGELLKRRADGGGHFLFATRVHHHIGNAAHQIFTKADLRVHQACGRFNFACGEIGEVGCNRGGTNVDGKAVSLIMKARPDCSEAVAPTRAT